MNICLFGGAFDPIHKGHLKLAQVIIEEYKCDKFIFIPSKTPPHKNHHIASFFDRVNMLNIAIADMGDIFLVSDIEHRLGNISYTFNTLSYFRSIYKNDTIYFLVGSDIFATIETWSNWKSLFTMADFIVAERPGYSFDKMRNSFSNDVINILQKNIIHYIKFNGIDTASSIIRHNISLSAEYIPEKVLDYIKINKLYIEE